MPLDTTEFDKRIRESQYDGIALNSQRRVYGQKEAVMQLALEVVKANFPDIVAKTNTKVSGKEPKSANSYGEYEWNPLTGVEEIRLKNADRYMPATQAGTTDEGKPFQKVNFTTQEVLESVNTVLHEIYHGQSKGGRFRHGAKEAEGLLSEEDKRKINKLAVNNTNNFAASLFSMKKSGLDVEEFLANAFALTNMRDRKMIVPGSRSEEQLRTLDEIIAAVPNAKKFIELQMQPAIPSLAEPPATTTEKLYNTIKGLLK